MVSGGQASLGSAVLELTADRRKLERDLEGARRSVRQKLDSVGRDLTVGGAAVSAAITAPIVGFGLAAVTSFASFDKAMTQSLAIMGDVEDELQDEMVAAARAVGRETTFSATAAAESYFFLASAGLDAVASVEAMPRVAQFAQAGMFDLATATDLLTDAQSALGLTIRDDSVANMENMVRVSDVLVKANTLANASVQQFSEALTSRAGAALRIVNKDLEEGAAVLAAFADQGVKGAEAGTRLDIVLRDLQNAANRNGDEFERLNIRVFDGEGNMRNMADIVEDLEGALEGMSDSQVRATLTQLGFQDRSVASLLTLLGLSDAIREYESELRRAGGTTEEVADKQLESASAQWDLFKGRLEDTAIVLGAAVVPALLSMLDAVDPLISVVEFLANGFAALPGPVQATAVVLGLVAAAVGPLLILFGLAASGASAVAGAYVTLSGAAGALSGSLRGVGVSATFANRAIGGGLIGLVISAAAAFGVLALNASDAAASQGEAAQAAQEFEIATERSTESIQQEIAGRTQNIQRRRDEIAVIKRELGALAEQGELTREQITRGRELQERIETLTDAIAAEEERIIVLNGALSEQSTQSENAERAQAEMREEMEDTAAAIRDESAALGELSSRALATTLAMNLLQQSNAGILTGFREARQAAIDQLRGIVQEEQALDDIVEGLLAAAGGGHGAPSPASGVGGGGGGRAAGAADDLDESLDDLTGALGGVTAGTHGWLAALEATQDALQATEERQMAEIVEAFIRGGDEAVEAVRAEQAALDAAWKEVVGGLQDLGVMVPEQFRAMFDRIMQETAEGAANAVDAAGGASGGGPSDAHLATLLALTQGGATQEQLDAVNEHFKNLPQLQHGGIVRSPTLAMIGEAGPEAVVPLDRASGGDVIIQFHGPVSSRRGAEEMVRGAISDLRRRGVQL